MGIAGQCSLAVEHSLSKREVVGSNPAIGCFFRPLRGDTRSGFLRERQRHCVRVVKEMD